MLKNRVIIARVSAAIALLLLVAVISYAQTYNPASAGKTDKAAKPASQMFEYLVISPHTAEECLTALNDVSMLGKDILAKYDWGCMSGDHTGYIKVQAASEAEALKVVPQAIRAKARVIKIAKFTPEQIAMAHKNH
jgi:hypothetical protein